MKKTDKKIKIMTLFCCWRFLQKYMWNLYLSLETQKKIYFRIWIFILSLGFEYDFNAAILNF